MKLYLALFFLGGTMYCSFTFLVLNVLVYFKPV